MRESRFVGDFVFVVELVERLVKRLHALLGGLAHQIFQQMHFTFSDMVRHQWCIDENFDGCTAALTIDRRYQLLRHHCPQVQRQIHPDLIVPVAGEEVNNSVQRLVCVVRVQRTQTQVAGLCERYRVFHGLARANLTNHDHVRCLAQCIFQRDFEAVRIHPNFALRDDAAFVLVNEFDGIFDADDVAGGIFVAMTDHCSQRGRFTGTCRADKNDQAAPRHREFFNDGRQPEVGDERNVDLDAAQHHAGEVTLLKCAHPEASEAARVDGKITFVGAFKVLLLIRVHHTEYHFFGLLRREARLARGEKLAVDLQHRRFTRRDEQIRSTLLND